MVTFIIYKNYIVSNLGEIFIKILKILSKAVHNCRSWQSSIDFTKKRANIFYSKTYKKYHKNKDRVSHLFFEANLGKKFNHKNQLFLQKKKKKNLLQSYTDWSLQPVRIVFFTDWSLNPVSKKLAFNLKLLLWHQRNLVWGNWGRSKCCRFVSIAYRRQTDNQAY